MAYKVNTSIIPWSQHLLENMIISGSSVILQPSYLVPITLSGLVTESQITNIPITSSSLFDLQNNDPGQIALFKEYDILTQGQYIQTTVSQWASPSAVIQAVIPQDIISNGQTTLYMEVNPTLKGSLQTTLSESQTVTQSSVTLGNFDIMGYQLTGQQTTPIIDSLQPKQYLTLSLSQTLTQDQTIDLNNSSIEQVECTGSMDQPTTPTMGQFVDSYGYSHNYWQPNDFGNVEHNSVIVDDFSFFEVPYKYYQFKFQINQQTPAIDQLNNQYYATYPDGSWDPNPFIDWLNKYGNYNNYIINHLFNKIIIKAVNNSTVMNIIWSNDSLRQMLWKSSDARLALYNNPAQLKALTVDSTPNLIDETPLNTDYNAGYLLYAEKDKGTGDWTAVNINDNGKYLVWIHFHSYYDQDWYNGKIASYDQSTDLQETDGGNNLTRGNFNTTSNGLWVYFHDRWTDSGNSSSYARVWYIKV